MRKQVSLLAAAALAVGGFSLAPAQADEQQQQHQQRTTVIERDTDNPAERAAERTGDAVERTGDRIGDTAQQAGERTRDAARETGDRADGVFNPGFTHEGVDAGHAAPDISEREANNIRGTLSAATEAALTKGQLRSVVQRLTTADQRRLMEPAEQDHPELDQLIERFSQDWQNRYNEEFNIGERAQVFPPEQVRMVQGVLPDPRLAGDLQGGQQSQPGQLDQQHQLSQEAQRQQPGQDPAHVTGPDTGTARQDVNQQQTQTNGVAARGEIQVGTDRATPEDDAGPRLAGDRDATRHAEQGRLTRDTDEDEARPAPTHGEETARVNQNQVTVIFPENHGLPQVAVPVINEGTVLDAWRIDAPLTLDGQKLRTNIHKALSKAHQNSDQWPQDVNEAYRYVSHHVMLAIMDRMDEMHGQQGQQGQFQQQPEQTRQLDQPSQQQGQTQQPAGTGQGQTTY